MGATGYPAAASSAAGSTTCSRGQDAEAGVQVGPGGGGARHGHVVGVAGGQGGRQPLAAQQLQAQSAGAASGAVEGVHGAARRLVVEYEGSRRPRPVWQGMVTCMPAAAASAASAALPPAASMRRPNRDACGDDEATMPRLESAGERRLM